MGETYPPNTEGGNDKQKEQKEQEKTSIFTLSALADATAESLLLPSDSEKSFLTEDETILAAIDDPFFVIPLTNAQAAYVKEFYPDTYESLKKSTIESQKDREEWINEFEQNEKLWYKPEYSEALFNARFHYEKQAPCASRNELLSAPLWNIEIEKLEEKKEFLGLVNEYYEKSIGEILEYLPDVPYIDLKEAGAGLLSGLFGKLHEDYDNFEHIVNVVIEDPSILEDAFDQVIAYVKEQGITGLAESAYDLAIDTVYGVIKDADLTEGKSISVDVGYYLGMILTTVTTGGSARIALTGAKLSDNVVPQLGNLSSKLKNREVYTKFMQSIGTVLPNVSAISIRALTEGIIQNFDSLTALKQSELAIDLVESFTSGSFEQLLTTKDTQKFLVDVIYELEDPYIDEILYEVLTKASKDSVTLNLLKEHTGKNHTSIASIISKDQVCEYLGLE